MKAAAAIAPATALTISTSTNASSAPATAPAIASASASARASARASASAKKGKGKQITSSTSIYYGDAGRGFGSRIRGQEGRSTYWLQMTLYSKSKSKLIDTKEYLSSKLCCLFDTRVEYPKRRNGRSNFGVVKCINPDCYGKKLWILTLWQRCECCH
ncbi:hypothetical protein BC941DRAFT_101355 [Chlamydoabsidia padenii]|nr:hypothetical protein BC941DRAFT_101355 [Chlamydoabsidia padenii]